MSGTPELLLVHYGYTPQKRFISLIKEVCQKNPYTCWYVILQTHASHQLIQNQRWVQQIALLMRIHHYIVVFQVLFSISLSLDHTSPMNYNKYVFSCITPCKLTCMLLDAFCDIFKVHVIIVCIFILHLLPS